LSRRVVVARRCPKCGRLLSEDVDECPYCGWNHRILSEIVRDSFKL
jgi:RNA polymerase subunit RPABC4/transcription elongation factor Spt4